MPRQYSRSLRVATELQRLLNELLFSEVKDPRLEGVRVSEVELSGDLGVATVFFSTLELDADPSGSVEAFEKARGFLRTRVGQTLRLRHVPELRFEHDTSARRGIEISRLIDRAQSESPSTDDDAD